MVGPRPSDAGWRDIDAGKTKPDLEGSGFSWKAAPDGHSARSGSEQESVAT
jgi:hypothetical protein